AHRAPPGDGCPRDLPALVLRRTARRRRADDPVRAPPAQGRRPAMTRVSLRFLGLLFVGAPVAVAVGAAGFAGAILASPAPVAVTVQQMLHQVDSFVLLAF